MFPSCSQDGVRPSVPPAVASRFRSAQIIEHRDAAKFRHTLLSARGTVSAPMGNEEKAKAREDQLTKRRSLNPTRSTNSAGARKGATGRTTKVMSVEEGIPLSYTATLDTAARQARAGSGWSVLTNLNDELCRLEDQKKRELRRLAQQEQRDALESQLQEHERQRRVSRCWLIGVLGSPASGDRSRLTASASPSACPGGAGVPSARGRRGRQQCCPLQV